MHSGDFGACNRARHVPHMQAALLVMYVMLTLYMSGSS